MNQESKSSLWEVLTAVATAIGVICSICFYFGTKYSTENKIVEALSERYESVDREMSYEQALQAVDKDIEKLKNDKLSIESQNSDLEHTVDSLQNEIDSLQSEIGSLQTEIDFLNQEMEHSEKLALAESYAVSGNYETAIPLLNSLPEKTEDVVALLKNYTTNFETSVNTQAEALASDWQFEEAIDLIDEALKVVPNSQILLSKKKNITPKYLVETIECYKAENLWLLDNRKYIKMGGKSYKHAIYSQQSDVVASMFNDAYSASAFYNLDGKYS